MIIMTSTIAIVIVLSVLLYYYRYYDLNQKPRRP